MADLSATLTFKTKVWVAERVRDMAISEGRSISNVLSRIVEEWVVKDAGLDVKPSSKPLGTSEDHE